MRHILHIWVILLAAVLLAGCNLLQKPQPKLAGERSQTGVTLEGVPAGDMTAEEIRQIAKQLAAVHRQDPVNAGFSPDVAGITAAKDGIAVDVETTVQTVLAAPVNTAVNPSLVAIKPQITTEKLQAARLAGQAKTPLLDKGENRVHNIQMAAHVLTNTTVLPGETCSFNKLIGNTTLERGYRKAPIMEKGQIMLGVGGGICQISSTLYSAALAGNLPVVERHSHSKPVNYIAEGMDATTSDDKDFKFRNNRRGLLVLHVLVTDHAVCTDIWELPP